MPFLFEGENMENLKSLVYELILKGSSGQYDLKMIASILKLESTADFIMLNKVLNELEDEYLIVRNKKDKYLLANQARVYKGIISVNSKGKGFLDLEDHTIIIPKENLNGALDNDEVIVKLTSKKTNDTGYVEKVIKRNTTNVIGTLTIVKKVVMVTLDEDKLNNYRIRVTNADKFKLVNGLKALFKIVEYPYIKNENKPPIMKLEIVKIIGHKDDPGVDILSILLAYDIDPIFPDDVMLQTEQIPQEVSEESKKGRKDLTSLDIVTIDGDDAKDFDDAISIERTTDGFELGVHIADVSYYVEYNTPLDIEARTRGTSTYVVDRVVPMLPHLLSNGICSLNPDVERLTLSCVMKINLKGEIVDYELFESVIKSKYRMTYNNVNKIFNGDKEVNKEYKDISHIFYLMKDCAKLLRKRRDLNGSIDFDKEESVIVVDEKGKVLDIKKRERGESERIIEDFMISANECVAKHLKHLSVPVLYRIHETPKTKRIEDFKRVASLMGHVFRYKGSVLRPMDVQKYLNGLKGSDDYSVISTLMLRSMQKARYDAKPVGHFGLALEDYLHFTSPIRRYPDLVVHRMLKKYCFRHYYDELASDERLMNDLSIQTSERERAAIDAERDVDSMKMAEYMLDHIGKVYEGIVSSVTSFGFFVELDNLVEGLVRIQTLRDDYYHYDENTMSLIGENKARRIHLGQKVKIKVTGANKLARTIDFELVKENNKEYPKRKNNKEYSNKNEKKIKSKINRWR